MLRNVKVYAMVCVAFIRTTKGNVRGVFMVTLLFGVTIKIRAKGVHAKIVKGIHD